MHMLGYISCMSLPRFNENDMAIYIQAKLWHTLSNMMLPICSRAVAAIIAWATQLHDRPCRANMQVYIIALFIRPVCLDDPYDCYMQTSETGKLKVF